eukprot:TRINITY_DN14930_c0_g1_i4.p1 TRINITY_DN14930_c0_g1~~TRINITY_DN14930_c0_g1_i4.p1  ORF type:complete len:251 (-),score=65.93 TRINITY_DN14930_c0_g1_i4:74-826(-)
MASSTTPLSPDSGYSRILQGPAGRAVQARNHDQVLREVAEAWVQEKLAGEVQVTDILGQMRDGAVLCRLCEVITGERFPASTSNLQHLHLANVAGCLSRLATLGCPVSTTPDEVLAGECAEKVVELLLNMQRTFDPEGVHNILPAVTTQNNNIEAERLPVAPLPASGEGVQDWGGDSEEGAALAACEERIERIRTDRYGQEENDITGAYASSVGCLLYTSDAADEEDSVDLGGRRIIKKKKKSKLEQSYR